MSRGLLRLFLLVTAIGSISAHFTLDYPPTRGFIEDDEDKFCGGFPVNSTGRHPFPLSGPATVAITSHHGNPQFEISISFQPNANTSADFNSSNNAAVLMSWSQLQGGASCFPINITSATGQITPRPTNGTLATLQVQYRDGDRLLNQCSDLILVQNATTPSNLTCNSSSSSGGAAGTSTSTPRQGARSAARSSYHRIEMLAYAALIVATMPAFF